MPVVTAASIEQIEQGSRPPAVLLESFDGHGFGTVGPHGAGGGRNPSDNSMAVGPNHIVETVNSRLAVYTKAGELFETTGEVIYGPIGTNVLFAGFGGPCEARPNGDAVVRYDQLADRWLYVMPLFRRAPSAPGEPPGPYGMCYAVSAGANPIGPFHRYYFERELFPDYPRPAVWPDGYYVPTSTGDDVIEKHACVVDRDKMLRGLPATEQCIIIPDVNFLNNADIDGQGLPPAGAPNIMMATGGAQLREDYDDDGIYAWKFYVDWDDPENTRLEGPQKIEVAPYHYLCDGQLTRCVPQPDTDNRLDSQGDKIMQRLVYRNIDGRESIVAVHSVTTEAGGGGVRWYEFRLDDNRDPVLHQQGTYAPDEFYRWMASPGMDRQGNIGIGYSFGGTPHYAGQRFAGRLADDPLGQLTFHETVLVDGQASQTNTLRWQDYTQLSMDPTDDCTFWYVGDYLKAGADSYTTKIGAFRLPGCLRGTVNGTSFYDRNHNGMREPNEPGLAGWTVEYAGARQPVETPQPSQTLPPDQRSAPSGTLTTDVDGNFGTWLPADPAYFEPVYTFSAARPSDPAWTRFEGGSAYGSGGALPMTDGVYTIRLTDRDDVVNLDFGSACVTLSSGGTGPDYWLSEAGRAALEAVDEPLPEEERRRRGGGFGPDPAGGWRLLLTRTAYLVDADGNRFAVAGTGGFDEAYQQLTAWLGAATADNPMYLLSARLATTALNVAYGSQAAEATVLDPVAGDWVSIGAILARVSGLIGETADAAGADRGQSSAEAYGALLESLNANTATITPPAPAMCPQPF
jgi:hypothetical protein